MPASDELFRSAVDWHRSGQWAKARQAYEAILASDPRHAPALNALGALWQRSGELAEAINLYRRALEIEPANADYHFNLGCALEQQGDAEGALAGYRQALARNPKHARARANLASLFVRQQRLAEAQDCWRQAIALNAADATAHCELGNLHQRQNEFDDAIDCYQRALVVDANHIDALCNLGNALRMRRRFADALGVLQRAVILRPDFAPAQSNLGVTFQTLGRLGEAVACLQSAVRLDPGRALYRYNLGTMLMDQGRPAEAIAAFEQALYMNPQYHEAICARGIARLQLGQFSEGWKDYESRDRCPQFSLMQFPQPRWDGSPLEGRTLLVHGEQGLGDTLQFIRYLKFFRPDERVVVAAQRPLLGLLEQSGYRVCVAKEDPLPEFDVQLPLMSLPLVFHTRLENIPRDVPYLAAAQQRIDRWRDRLQAFEGMRIGIAWQGRTDERGLDLRTAPLASFAPLAAVPGVRLVSLQKGAGGEQLATIARQFEVVDLGPDLDAEGAFLDTAAVMRNLDLVVSIDTSIAHLAGALGVPVWVALCVVPDWRWMLEREDSPWYPTMRLFRQRQVGRWDDVFGRMASALGELRQRT